MSAETFAIVSTTVGQLDTAQEIAGALITARLAACVQITQIESVYRWHGTIEQADEWLLQCKIAAGDFARVEAAITSRHPYEVPEIVMTPISAGSAGYLAWLAAETRRDDAGEA